jgi:uncharacterized membrane protein
VAAIIIAAVGTVILIILLIIIYCCCCREESEEKKKARVARKAKNGPIIREIRTQGHSSPNNQTVTPLRIVVPVAQPTH